MKIYVDNVPQEGLELKEKIEPGKLSLNQDPQGLIFTGSIDVTAKATRAGTELFVELTLEGPVEYACSKCLAKLQEVFKKNFSVNYEVKSRDVIEVDEDIRQEIILAYPIKTVCKTDCKGLCPNCGQNFNTGTCDCNK